MSEGQPNYNTLEALTYYLNCLFPPSIEGFLELRPFSDQEPLFPHKYQARRFFCSADEFLHKLPTILGYLKQHRNGCFIGVVPRTEQKGKKEHIDKGFAIWSDIDDKDTGSRKNTLKKIADLPLEPSCIVESGGGCHVYYFLSQAATGPEIEAANKLLIQATDGDRAASDCTRILRLPLSYHCKEEPPVLVQFLALNDKKYLLEEVVDSLGGEEQYKLNLEKDTTAKKIHHKPQEAIAPTVEELMQKHPRIEQLYHGIGKESGGQSPSEYDYAFVRELIYWGANEAEACNALQSKIICDGRKKPDSYIQRTVGKASADIDRRRTKKPKLQLVPSLPPDVAPAQLERYPEDYSNKMLRGRPLPTLVNLLKILRQRASGSDRAIQYNTFKNQIELFGKKIEDYKSIKLMESIFVTTKTEWKFEVFSRSLEAIAREFQYHPVKEHLKRCHKKWIADGKKERIKDLFVKYCKTDVIYKRYWVELGADGTPTGNEIEKEQCKLLLLKELARCFLVGAVARIFNAGCKLDTTLILGGKQGCGKSTFFKLMASSKNYKELQELLTDSPSWFCDSKLDPSGGRDTYSKLSGTWLYEFAELAATRKKDAETIKAFLSSSLDKYSPKYARYDVEQKRSVVFCGTTNELEILRDLTGNRRFHIVECGDIDLEGLLEIRDLLWGEAVQMHKDGLGYHLAPKQQEELDYIQRKFKASDTWVEAIERWLSDTGISHRNAYTTEQILSGAIKMDVERQNRAVVMRVAGILSNTGWRKKRVKVKDKRIWKWTHPAIKDGAKCK